MTRIPVPTRSRPLAYMQRARPCWPHRRKRPSSSPMHGLSTLTTPPPLAGGSGLQPSSRGAAAHIGCHRHVPGSASVSRASCDDPRRVVNEPGQGVEDRSCCFIDIRVGSARSASIELAGRAYVDRHRQRTSRRPEMRHRRAANLSRSTGQPHDRSSSRHLAKTQEQVFDGQLLVRRIASVVLEALC